MKFSILIANYNNGRFFQNCYNSIIAQNYSNWEVIILDDCSTDNSVEIINRLIDGDKRFKLFKNETNSGVGITKAKLIELADGDICGFVDPDDAISPNALRANIIVFEKEKDVVLCYSKFSKFDENFKPLGIEFSTKQVINNDPYFFNCPVHIVHFVAFRKGVYMQTEKMNTSLKIAEDQDLYLKMYEKGKVHFINENNYYYRIHSGGISQNNNRPKTKEYFAEVIFNTMKRRNLKTIHGKHIPETYTNPQDIYDLLEYQNTITFRIKKKISLLLQKVF